MLPFGLTREEAAHSIGCKVGLFDRLVRDGVMPRPRELGAKKVWYTAEIKIAFEALPYAGDVNGSKEANPVGTKARLAFALLLNTGQRRSDVVKMGKQHIQDGFFNIRQQKTGKKLWIPISSELASVLEKSELGELTFLVTKHGMPYTAEGFGNWFRTVCDEAGLNHCTSHGLRKSAATALAECGCSEHEIKAITGHSRSEQVAVYTEKADQKRLASSAIRRLTE